MLESLSYAARVFRKWKIMCEYVLKRCKIRYDNAEIEGTDAYYEELWELLMRNIEQTYGQRFPF